MDKILATECSYEDVVVDVGIVQLLIELEMMIDRDIGDTHEAMYDNPRVLHGVWGVQTEVAELVNAYKTAWFYHKPLDTVNILEEIGDVLFYVTLLEDEVGDTFYGTRDLLDKFAKVYDSDLEECYDKLFLKLKARYGDKFSNEKANNRDLDAERKVLES